MSSQESPQEAPEGDVRDVGPVDPFEWLHAHPWPRVRRSEPRPVLTPEEFGEVPLSPEDRTRRARLLARVREENHPWR